MSNNTKIRTMQDDLKGTKNEQDKQQKSSPEVIQKKTQRSSVQSNASQPAQPNTLQAIHSDAQQPPAKPASIQDNKLKELVKKISAQTDKDFDDKYQTKEKGAEIVDDLAYKNRNEPTINREETLKEIANEPVEKKVDNKNVDDIEALKKLIHRISEPNPVADEKKS